MACPRQLWWIMAQAWPYVCMALELQLRSRPASFRTMWSSVSSVMRMPSMRLSWVLSQQTLKIGITVIENSVPRGGRKRNGGQCCMWSCSLEKHGLRYTGFLGDGDSKAYDLLVSMDVYKGTAVKREQCVYHAHKRMGTALLNLTKQQKLRHWPSHEEQGPILPAYVQEGHSEQHWWCGVNRQCHLGHSVPLYVYRWGATPYVMSHWWGFMMLLLLSRSSRWGTRAPQRQCPPSPGVLCGRGDDSSV